MGAAAAPLALTLDDAPLRADGQEAGAGEEAPAALEVPAFMRRLKHA
jgi:hypothetical protein